MKATSSATVFHVSDLEASIAYYDDALGFEEDFRFGDYAGMKLGSVAVHLVANKDQGRPVGTGQVYLFCDEVDDYGARVAAAGAVVLSEPSNTAYGLRELRVADPDGNRLSFGCEA